MRTTVGIPKLETGEWHCSVHIREMKTGESTDVCSKHRSDELTEEAIITVEPKSLTFIHTVRRGGNWHGSSDVSLPIEMRLLGPEMKAEMAVMQAEIPADMAGMRPQMDAMAIQMKNFKGPGPEQMRKLEEDLKNLEVTPKQPAPPAPSQP